MFRNSHPEESLLRETDLGFLGGLFLKRLPAVTFVFEVLLAFCFSPPMTHSFKSILWEAAHEMLRGLGCGRRVQAGAELSDVPLVIETFHPAGLLVHVWILRAQ